MQRTRFFFILFLLSLALFLSFDEPDSDLGITKDFIVVLDAGHGGHDPGNLGNGYLEKNIALSIVLQAGKLLEKEPGVKVVYTRKDDTFVDLYVRGEIANKANADLFVSVHCDSHTSDAHGAGTFVLGLHANKQNFEIAKKENSVIYLEDNYETRYAEYDINSPESVIGLTIMQEEFLDQSILLASMMQENFSKKLRRNDRKVKQAGFIVLHQTFMPSVLIETGFLTNKSEGSYLNSSKGQSEMGRAIADAIVTYKNGVPLDPSLDTSPVPEVPAENTAEVEPSQAPELAAVKSGENEVADPASSEPDDQSNPPQQTTSVLEKTTKTGENKPEAQAETKPLEKEGVAESRKDNGRETETLPEPKKTEKQVAAVENEINVPKVIVKEPVQEKAEPETKTAVEEPVKKTETASSSKSSPEKPEEKSVANITFKVQLLASSKDLPLRAEDFRGLNTLSKEPYKNLFRYMYGNTNSYFQATLYKSNADAKGYTSSFIVAYKDGVRIPIKEALNYVSE